ncbi:hypothetical protein K7957_12550 [Sphingomonas yunnanensis]|uniref:hypothetical protein n=1 Tax=Sphingomonas yunnanensis TaxID=310400 RepID=UPI001CA7039A|nr:hypothetical protein [Sphingomonas yunnanensis]MBY9063764.1 hypothetical protein [Sphingomonas yunnanensis]
MPRRRVLIRPAALAMLARCITALLGGYAATAALVSLVSRLLPLSRAEATAWGMITSFLVYSVIGLWCFHEPKLVRVAALVWGVALVGGGTIWLIGARA